MNAGSRYTADSNISVIAIGASAGGLEAISHLLSNIGPDIPHAVVILQHLSPNYKSMMAELLTRETRLRVVEMQDGEVPQSGVAYVVPPNKNAVLRDDQFTLQDALPEISPKPSINEFFISLAAELGERAVGVILSGTGTDGTAGLRAIQAAGGIAIVQSPESAKYSGMPLSAIDAGASDFILEPEEISAKLMALPSDMLVEVEFSPSTLERIIQLLNKACDVDFSGYKVGTLSRRVRRRMVATAHSSMESYLEWLEDNSDELDMLSKDILISVTSFFRDSESFAGLRDSISDILSNMAPDEEFRAWVAGCATGEEAYTLAILILEELQQQSTINRVQIFATDIDEEALNFARQGLYPSRSLKALPEELLEKYFIVKNDGQYEVHKNLRDMIVFARHNVINDPPFLHLNLVTCRNVLIYFDNALQSKVLQRFHFALKQEGVLFLGRSESVAQAEQLFIHTNRRERIFRKHGDSKPRLASTISAKLPVLPRVRSESPQLLLDAFTEHYGVTAALCTLDGRVLQTSGEVETFFRFPSGSSDIRLPEVIDPVFQTELLALLHQLKKSHSAQYGRPKELAENFWQLSLSPVSKEGESWVLLLISKHQESPKNVPSFSHDNVYSDELEVTREQLQSLIEELATANEEMQSLNEEAQASNEELQATNEEMEAANEELQATNEELVSLNEELSIKTNELIMLNEEYSHLYDSFDFPVLVFDSKLNLVRFNSPAAMAFNLRGNASNIPIGRIKFPEFLCNIEQVLGLALSHAEKQEAFLKNEHKAYQLVVNPGLSEQGAVKFLVLNLLDITEIQKTRNLLAESENRLQTVMENTYILIATKDLSGRYLFANDAFLNSLNIQDIDYEMKTDFDLFPGSFAGQIWSNDLRAIRELGIVESESSLLVDGKVRVFRTVHQVLRDHNGTPNMIITESEDITTRKQAEEKLKIAAKVYQQAGEGIVVTDKNGFILSINDAFTAITGFSEVDSIGAGIGQLLQSGRHSKQFYNEMWNVLDNKGHWQGEIWNKKKNGEVYPEWLTINRIMNDKNETDYFIAVFSDISNLKESQRKVEFLATHDPLTGLPNRNLFQDRLDSALARSKRDESSLAVLFIDLDNFKSINDTLGHDVGDRLLVEVSGRLQAVVRDIDTVSRLGGDEFTVIITECGPADVQDVSSRILSDLTEPVDLDGRKIFASASIGIAMYPEDGEDSNGLLKSADTAMYKAKESGRNRFQFFHTEMRDKLLKQSVLESSLKYAIRHNQFRLVFQPKFSAVDSRRIVGAEALLRWNEPQLGDISPAEFIPLAEQTGDIIELSNLVIDMLAEHIARWLNRGLNLPPIAFNVSTRSLKDEHYAKELVSRIDTYMIPHQYFNAEITEGSLMGKSSVEIENLNVLKEQGFCISIDDFGTGYSSLSYLKTLPLEELKIDKSFVDGLGEDENDEAICRAILSMAKALGLKVVAEGVETELQKNWLIENKCDYLQGFLLSKPLEALDFEKIVTLNC
ncbi:EAL domain-containing protein [Neptuniibacter sp.]|uniref:EAL domain-containing protein n=1 Tax=Neptuniibacter sp. TaxID=1962643 RepID=UPI00262FE317|nr:EAL domain-containing protein [Neptuniibacter sp.]MCP4595489.1 EAL domain-containing protein [Neptuniibacter sp.]